MLPIGEKAIVMLFGRCSLTVVQAWRCVADSEVTCKKDAMLGVVRQLTASERALRTASCTEDSSSAHAQIIQVTSSVVECFFLDRLGRVF